MTTNEDDEKKEERTLNVAIVGCSHGELDTIYESIAQRERELRLKVDLLLCCGDFQAMRNAGDLDYMHCPPKYRKLGDFQRYYAGEAIAPILTIIVGGNHENSAYSQELPHGGWIAPNMYFMGFASVVNYGGLRIAGWSGIYKHKDYLRGHHEAPPFKYGGQVSAYHVRSIERFRLGLLEEKKPNDVDVFMTHDWPVGVTAHGDEFWLLQQKPHFTDDVRNNCLGSPFSAELLHALRPSYWFAGHMHVKFAATINHKDAAGEEVSKTEFLALHKCIAGKGYGQRFALDVQKINVRAPLSLELRYDARWLAILKKTTNLEAVCGGIANIPAETAEHTITDADLAKIDELFDGDLVVPFNFRQTAPPQREYKPTPHASGLYYRNPQTKEFCEKLQIPDLNEELCKLNMNIVGHPHYVDAEAAAAPPERNTNEIELPDDELFDDDDFVIDTTPAKRQKIEENE